jgi:hypothetical protein
MKTYSNSLIFFAFLILIESCTVRIPTFNSSSNVHSGAMNIHQPLYDNSLQWFKRR